MTKKDIVIIDSGVFYEHPLLSEIDIEGVTVRLVDGGYRICPDAYDEIGHGTAVCGTIFSNMLNKTDFHVLMIKIYEESTCVELGALLFALSYIEREIDCDIIHISSGVLEYSQELHELCRHLTQKEICIVAAFDNNGCVSYPAAYDEVIGVDASQECRKWNEWIYVENGIVNILAKGGNHRLAWISPNYILTQGASFSAGYITGLIAKKLKDGLPKDAIKKFLRENAVKIYNRSSLPQNNPVFNFTPHRVALFPYNKEMHSLINYYDMLSFEIHGIYSSKYLGHVGRDVFSLNGRHHFTIQNIDDLDWNAIDTLILGHVFEISQAAQMDYKNYTTK